MTHFLVVHPSRILLVHVSRFGSANPVSLVEPFKECLVLSIFPLLESGKLKSREIRV